MVKIRTRTIVGDSCQEVNLVGEAEERGEEGRVEEVVLVDREALMILEMKKLVSGGMKNQTGKEGVEGKFLLACKEVEGKEPGQEVGEGRRERSGKPLVRPAWRRGRREIKSEGSPSQCVPEVEEGVVVVSRAGIGTNQEGEGRETLGAGPRPEPGDPRKGDRGRELLRLQPKEGLGLKTLI